MDQTSTIHSADTGFIHAVFKLSFSKQYCGECMIALSLPRSGACNLAILNCAPVFASRLVRCACGLGMQYCKVFF